ncbi:uncharacterized protein DUF4397 [Terracoccus luteus]|uniref:Uncharacterized protein DUF4397 n=1 Tax=Terracoccus luteus TaxID=53356 RepID=A0A495Y0R3_9MICO|nr:DUF4397 domain-containing protein [Terracoccus luteus]RKT79015.1 uncharacterized protein DUF4397 [Terracoccus luteus]
MKTVRIAAVTMLALAPLGMATTAHAAGESAVSVLHAVPGATVDVYANGKALLTDFKPGTLTDPVMLAEGSYDLKVVAAGDGADGKAIVEAKDVAVPADANITVVAHLTADGAPALTPYVNDTSSVPAGQARLTVRHDAAAPAVDVRANGEVALKGLTNPKEAKAVVPAGTISADVVLAGTDTVAIGPADVSLKEGTNTIVYAWGSAADKNLMLATQVVGGMSSAPGGVNAGGSGQAAAASNEAGRYLAIAGAAALAGGVVLVSRRKATR